LKISTENYGFGS